MREFSWVAIGAAATLRRSAAMGRGGDMRRGECRDARRTRERRLG